MRVANDGDAAATEPEPIPVFAWPGGVVSQLRHRSWIDDQILRWAAGPRFLVVVDEVVAAGTYRTPPQTVPMVALRNGGLEEALAFVPAMHREDAARALRRVAT